MVLELLDEPDSEFQQCQNCAFSMKRKVGDVTCRREPPRIGKDEIGIWPRVRITDWCGAWEMEFPPDDDDIRAVEDVASSGQNSVAPPWQPPPPLQVREATRAQISLWAAERGMRFTDNLAEINARRKALGMAPFALIVGE